MNSNINKRKNKFNFKQKKDCCVQSLKDVNSFLYNFSKTKKLINIFKWLK